MVKKLCFVALGLAALAFIVADVRAFWSCSEYFCALQVFILR